MRRWFAALTGTAALAAAGSALAQPAAPGFAGDISGLGHRPSQLSADGSAGAGAELQLGSVPQGQERLRLGAVQPKPRMLAKAPDGRWSLFAAASGRQVEPAVAGAAPAWATAASQEDRASAYLTSAKAGVAWRKGDAQVSVGYVHRKLEVSGARSDLLSDMPKSDHVAGLAFSFTLR